jgi:hypothetical protein
VINLLGDTGPYATFFRLPAIVPDTRPGQRFHKRDGPEADFLWAVALFDRLTARFPDAAAKEVSSWPEPEPYVFDKFRLFAWLKLFSAAQVAEGILKLIDGSFWSSYLQRELLHLLAARWADFTVDERRQIENRIIAGRPRYAFERPEEHEDSNVHVIGTRLGWLSRNNCELTDAGVSSLTAYRARSDWKQQWEEDADHDMDSRGGWVEQRKEPGDLTAVPVCEIIGAAEARSKRDHSAFIEFAPFMGLVKERPFRALAALSFAGRKRHFPTVFWQQLLSEWPDEAPARLTWLCGKRVARLPQGVMFELRFYAPRWVQRVFGKRYSIKSDDTWEIWDAVFCALDKSGAPATESSIGTVHVGGRLVERSRKSIDYAINGPMGLLIQALFASVSGREFEAKDGLPADIKERLERGLIISGEGSDHTACLIGERLAWLYSVDPDWVQRAIIPLFRLTSPRSEAAWNGLLFTENVPGPAKLFALLRSEFLAIFTRRCEWLEDDGFERLAAHFLIIATFWRRHDRRYISHGECRAALQSMTDSGRQASLWTLGRILKEADAWPSFGKRFFSSIWPQEAQCQTSGTTTAMIQIAEDDPDRFPEIVRVVGPYLRPMEFPDLFLFRQNREDSNRERAPLVRRWPLQVLDVVDRIVAAEPRLTPHGLGALLDDVAEIAPSARRTRSWRRLHELISK